MKKMMFTILFLFLIAHIGAKVEIENKLPKMSLKLLNGKLINISSFLENGPILINFWATWCAPCLKEMKFLDKFNKKYIDSGFQVVSINTDTPRSLSKVKSFVKSREYSFNILLDPKSEYIRKAGGKVLPYLLLVNTDGTIFKRHMGYNPGDEITLEKEILEMIALNSADEDSKEIVNEEEDLKSTDEKSDEAPISE